MKIKTENVYIFGTGSQAKIISRIIKSKKKYNLVCFVSDQKSKKEYLQKKVLLLNNFLNTKKQKKIFIAIGDNLKRKKIYNLLKQNKKISFPNLIYDESLKLNFVKIGFGNLIMPGCFINNDVKIGNFCVLNTGSIIEHDCKIGSFNSISPGAVLSGNCKTKEDVFIGSNATIIHNVQIGKKSVIGAGTVVIKNIGDNNRIIGNPSRKIKQKLNYL